MGEHLVEFTADGGHIVLQHPAEDDCDLVVPDPPPQPGIWRVEPVEPSGRAWTPEETDDGAD